MLTEPSAEIADTSRVVLDLSHDDAGAVLNALVWRQLHIERAMDVMHVGPGRDFTTLLDELAEGRERVERLERVIAHIACAMSPLPELARRASRPDPAPGNGARRGSSGPEAA